MLKKFKTLLLTALMALLLAPTAWGGSATVKANVGSAGGGEAYVSLSSSEDVSKYSTTETSVQWNSGWLFVAYPVTETAYFSARAKDGYRFLGWSETADVTSSTVFSHETPTWNQEYTAKTGSNNDTYGPYYAHFIKVENRQTTIYVGDEVPLSESFSDIKTFESQNTGVATVSRSGNTITVRGLAGGEATVVVKTLLAEYTYTVKVKERTAAIALHLALGAGGTKTENTLTYNGTPTITTQPNTSIATATLTGNTIKVSPVAAGTTTMVVVGKDANNKTVTYTYTISVTQETTGVVQIDDGFITYANATEAKWVGDEYVLVFDNATAAGTFTVPTPFMAEVDVLAVGGGGAGGTQCESIGGGGGGAGGYVLKEGERLMGGTFQALVGKGGEVPTTNARAEQGNSGRPSSLTDETGHTVVTAAGGGGGGASDVGLYNGTSGGSGGGGSWYTTSQTVVSTNEFGTVSTNLNYTYTAGLGGRGISGQGKNGAKAVGYNWGAGGGGADGDGGAGDANTPGAGGTGVTSSITGSSVVYAQGGAGGRKDSLDPATAGAGPGFGGNGGNGGLGGAGHDGAIIVRIKHLYQNVKVPVPTSDDALSSRFVWASGAEYCDFNTNMTFVASDGNTYQWTDVIDHIDGTVSATCSGTDGERLGVGNYLYVVYLKDGYTWDDGDPASYGKTNGQILRWVIVTDEDIIAATVKVTKQVSYTDEEHATVTIETATTPEMIVNSTPNVLFLGTVCGWHGLTKETICASLKAVTGTANVDYFLFAGKDGVLQPSYTRSGHYNKGATNIDSLDVSMANYMHAALGTFYDCLYDQLVTKQKKYDYIVFEFDGSRIADNYTKSDYEAEVADLLKPFYESGSVVWIVDNCDAGNREPWKDDYWRPNTYHYSDRSNQNLGIDAYRGLIGMFDPANYVEGGSWSDLHAVSRTSGGTTYYANPRYEKQAGYSNVSDVTELLKAVIKVTPSNLELTDKIVDPAKGLTIKRVNFKVCLVAGEGGSASTNPDDWHTFASYETATGAVTYPETITDPNGKTMAGGMVVVGNQVTVTINKVDYSIFTRLDTEVIDDGTFRTTTDDAKYNPTTHMWEKDPNDGAAHIKLISSGGSDVLAESECPTMIKWPFSPHMIVAGATGGEVGIDIPPGVGESSDVEADDRSTAEAGYSDGATSTVYYRGLPGYELVMLLVDDQELDFEGTDLESFYVFTDIMSDHKVEVIYDYYLGTNEIAPTTFEYDGEAHLCTVTPGEWAAGREVEIRYALSADGPFVLESEFLSANKNALKNVGDHEIYAQIWVKQLGYYEDEEGNLDPTREGWILATEEPLHDTVTITKRTVVVTPNPVHLPTTANTWSYNGFHVDNLVAGDEGCITMTPSDNNGYTTTYSQHIGQMGLYEIDIVGMVTDSTGNYTIKLAKGPLSVVKVPMVFGGVTQTSWLDPEDPDINTGVDRVEKMYDGQPAGLTVTVNAPDPVTEAAYREQYHFKMQYRVGDAGTWQDANPTFTEAGTYKVWYKAEMDDTYINTTNYQYVVITKRPITILSEPGEKRYDGTALTREKWVYKSTSLHVAETDTLTVTCTGSQTDIGTSDNTLTYTITCNGRNVSANYEVAEELGTLTVTTGHIRINDQEQDPDHLQPSGKNGVEDVEKVYDGQPASIALNVTLPENGALIEYSVDGGTTWTVTNPAFTDVGEHVVTYRISAENYATVVNTARVIINPRPVTVKADDQEGVVNEALPTNLTARILPETDPDKGVLSGEESLISYTVAYDSTVVNPPTAAGTFAEMVVPSGEETQGNYLVTFVKGALTVAAEKKIVSLWITDHADAGNGYIYLAFKPTLNAGELNAAFITKLANANRICVSTGATEADAKKATPVPVALRDPSEPLDKNNWVWVKVAMPETLSAAGAGPVWLITITD